MLYEALEILRNEVNVFLYQEGLEQKVVLDNIALLESEHGASWQRYRNVE